MTFFRWHLALVLCVGLSGCGEDVAESLAQNYNAWQPSETARRAHAPDSDQLRAYVGATLIDGTGAEAVQDATVLVRGREIVAAGNAVELPEHALIEDVRGKWIVPGLFDSHIHFMTSGRSYTRPAMLDLQHLVPYEDEIAWIEAHLPDTLRSMLCAGVTSVLSAGGPRIEYQGRELSRQMVDAPSVFVSHGVVANVPRFITGPIFPRWHGDLVIKPITSAEEGRAFVQQGAAWGADAIKTAVDDRGNALMGLMMMSWPSVHEAMIAEAKAQGLKFTSHVHQLETARQLVELGVDSLQHIPMDAALDDEFLALAKSSGVIVVPTLALRKRTFGELFSENIELLPIEKTCGIPDVIDSWNVPMPERSEEALKYGETGRLVAIENVARLNKAGVPMAAATDAGLMGLLHGASMHLELAEMRAAGMTNADLIVAATLTAARVAGKEARYGSIEPGKYADFLLLSANPLDNIANLQAIDTVVKYGQPFRQEMLLPR